jgi:type II secretory pathway component PulK
MTADLTQAILDWRDTNGNGPTVTYYAMQQPSYQCKCDPFETVDELRLLYGADMDTLLGEDANRNGILDPNETDENQNGMLDPGVLEYFTVYSREPNTNRVNLANPSTLSAQLGPVLQTNFGATRADQIMANLGLASGGASRATGGGGAGGRTGGGATSGSGGGAAPRVVAAATTVRFTSPLQFYVASQMTSTEFAQIATNLTATAGTYVEGRVNVNTASAAVLACLLGGDTGVAEQLVNYRQSNPNNLTSIAWVIDALGQSYPDALQTLEAGDYITTQSYQCTADVAALGPHGRGYRRVRFVFDTSTGTPKIVYRRDLTHVGWALGKEVRQNWLVAKATP